MGSYQSAGLYTEELPSGAAPLTAVSTSTFASVGWTPKGPENIATLITGTFGNFTDQFGSYWRNSYTAFVMANFFQNEGSAAYFVRVVPASATVGANGTGLDDVAIAASYISKVLPATLDLSVDKNIGIKIDGAAAVDVDCSAGAVLPAAVTRAEIVAAINTGTTGITVALNAANRITWVTDATGATKSIEFLQATINDNSDAILGLDVSGGKTYKYEGEDASAWDLASPWHGAYYNQVRAVISGNDDYLDNATGGWTKFAYEVQAESSVGAGDWETLETYGVIDLTTATDDFFAPTVINDKTNYCKITQGATFAVPRSLRPTRRLAEWLADGTGVLLSFSGTLLNVEVQPGSLSIVVGATTITDDGDGNLSGTDVTGTIEYDTGDWTLVFGAGHAPVLGVPLLATYYEIPSTDSVNAQLTGGTDGTGPITRALISDPALEADKKGIYAFKAVEEILNIALPDFEGNVAVQNDVIAFCENSKDRFAILATAAGLTPTDAVKFVRNTAQYDTSYAAIYYPWIKVYDPIADDGRSMLVPPTGFVAGVYARTDKNKNVGKAPGGIIDGKLVGAVGMERVLEKAERDLLYPNRINPIVGGSMTGRSVWGVRTLTKDAEWRYINVRRLFMFCEKSVENGSWWIVFENNGAGLWGRILAQGNGFFMNLFRDNYFAGASPGDAFKIVCDSTNNSQASIDAGFVIIDYYIAPNKPGEFVRLRWRQKTKQAA